MSQNLKACAKRLLIFSRLKHREARKFLKAANRKIIHALSEIAYNVREGVVKVSKRVKNSKVVKVLSEKTTPIKIKYQLLCAVAAPIIVRALVASVIAILQVLRNG